MAQDSEQGSETGEERPHETPFWDSMWGMLFLVAAIILARVYMLEPFKIPSGSMEPTLFGHEDHGDRILTNKLAYVTAARVWAAIGLSAVLIVVGFIASKSWRRVRSIVTFAIIAIAVVGGLLCAWVRKAVADEPRRFDVVVFQYNTEWAGEAPKDINYIKRLVGLPGETIVISGGDLFLRKAGKDELIRKWKERPDVQSILWFPVSLAWAPFTRERPRPDNPNLAVVEKQIATLRFPWGGVEEGKPGASLGKSSLTLDGTAPVALTYPFPVTNIYIKQGRWPFEHSGCPAANLTGVEGEGGVVFRNPKNKSEKIEAYVGNTCEGIQCPNCLEIAFPPADSAGPNIHPDPARPGKFFYGGDSVVGDLKLDLGITVETAGAIQLEVGSDLHRAVWSIGGPAPAGDGDQTIHPVQAATPALTPGAHTLSLAYVDGSVVAVLDGKTVEERALPLEPPGRRADSIKNVVRVSFTGVRGTLTRMDLYRDLHYLLMGRGMGLSGRDTKWRQLDMQNGLYVHRLQDDEFMMLGDNSPSSLDSRVWGHVPKDRLVGRASLVWWPPSRWRLIR